MILFASCGKKYNCHCNSTLNFNSGGTVFCTSDSSPMNEKMTKKQAQAVCDREASNIHETYKNIFSNNGSSTSFGSSKTNCTLQ